MAERQPVDHHIEEVAPPAQIEPLFPPIYKQIQRENRETMEILFEEGKFVHRQLTQGQLEYLQETRPHLYKGKSKNRR